jgi:GNAT superfamily N-acetyltransferase
MERGRTYLLAGAAVVAEAAGYLAWRPQMLRREQAGTRRPTRFQAMTVLCARGCRARGRSCSTRRRGGCAPVEGLIPGLHAAMLAGQGRRDTRVAASPVPVEVGVTAVGMAGSEETLRDGRVVVLRPLRADDAAGVEALWRRLDAPSPRRFTDLAHLPAERARDVALPRPGHAAGIAATAPSGQVAGVARYERTGGDTARFLLFVDAFWRRAGLGTLLLRGLAEAARHAGIRRLAGDAPRGDVAILGLLEELGLEYQEQVTAATVHASFAVQELMPTLTRCWPTSGLRPASRSGRSCARRRSPSWGAATSLPASAGCFWLTCWPAGSPGRSTRSTPATRSSRG